MALQALEMPSGDQATQLLQLVIAGEWRSVCGHGVLPVQRALDCSDRLLADLVRSAEAFNRIDYPWPTGCSNQMTGQ
ncbi:hypothetical protein thsps117_09070 [Pseudomonas sp. No.117]